MKNKLIKTSILAVVLSGGLFGTSILINNQNNIEYTKENKSERADATNYTITQGLTLGWDYSNQKFTIYVDAVAEATSRATVDLSFESYTGLDGNTKKHDNGMYQVWDGDYKDQYYKEYEVATMVKDYADLGLDDTSMTIKWDLTNDGVINSGDVTTSYNSEFKTESSNVLTFTKNSDGLYDIDTTAFETDSTNSILAPIVDIEPTFGTPSIYTGSYGSEGTNFVVKYSSYEAGSIVGDPTFKLKYKLDGVEVTDTLDSYKWESKYSEAFFTLPGPGTYTDFEIDAQYTYAVDETTNKDSSTGFVAFDTTYDSEWVVSDVVYEGPDIEEDINFTVSSSGDIRGEFWGNPTPGKHAPYFSVWEKGSRGDYGLKDTYAYTYYELDSSVEYNENGAGKFVFEENIDNFGSYSDPAQNTQFEDGEYEFDMIMDSSSSKTGWYSQEYPEAAKNNTFSIENGVVTFNENLDVEYVAGAEEATEVSMQIKTYQEMGSTAMAVVEITSDVEVQSLEMRYDGKVINATKSEAKSTSTWNLSNIPVEAKDNLKDIEVYINNSDNALYFSSVTDVNGKSLMGLSTLAIILIVLASLTIVGIIGVVLYLVFGGKKDKNKEAQA